MKRFQNLSIKEAFQRACEERKEGKNFHIRGNPRDGYYLIPEGLTYKSGLFSLLVSEPEEKKSKRTLEKYGES